MTIYFSDDFETGDMSKWTATEGTPDVVSTISYQGSYCCRIDADNEGARYNLGQTLSICFLKANVYFDNLLTVNAYRTYILRIGQDATYWGYPLIGMIYNNNGTVVWGLRDDYYNNQWLSTVQVQTHKWYEVQLEYSGTPALYVNGTQVITGTSKPPKCTRIGIGGSNAERITFYIDNVIVSNTLIASVYSVTRMLTLLHSSNQYICRNLVSGYDVGVVFLRIESVPSNIPFDLEMI